MATRKKATEPSTAKPAGRIRSGMGGWSYEPWQSTFYPAGTSKKRELEYASRQVTSIEINSTYYGTQKPATFAKWHAETPDDFVFSVKASRFCTNRKVLAEASDSITRFVDSGIDELGNKLGPIVWQFATTKRFEPDDFAAFLALLPDSAGGVPLRHALDVRHESFACSEFLKLARQHRAAVVLTDSDDYPLLADPTTDLMYCRLMRSRSDLDAGFDAATLASWAERARRWSAGDVPADLPLITPSDVPAVQREVFVYFISGAKERAPAAAVAFLKALAP